MALGAMKTPRPSSRNQITSIWGPERTALTSRSKRVFLGGCGSVWFSHCLSVHGTVAAVPVSVRTVSLGRVLSVFQHLPLPGRFGSGSGLGS